MLKDWLKELAQDVRKVPLRVAVVGLLLAVGMATIGLSYHTTPGTSLSGNARH